MAENIGVEVRRDVELERRMLEAVIAERNDQPRSKQLQVGPSSIGGCRELLRASLFEADTVAEPETHWATAAHVGSVMGADLETIFGRRLGALEQQRMTTLFESLGIRISGAIDLLFMNELHVTDLKSSDDIGGVLYDMKRNASAIDTLLQIWREGLLFNKFIETPDGGYELTATIIEKVAKLSYYIQVAIYVTGAIQQGILEADAEGRLVFYDRSGQYQEFVAIVITSEEISMFFEIAQARITQVADAQTAYENGGGNPAIIAHLRDMAPSFCFSKKVMCPRRMHCWAGSDWTNDNRITNPDQIAAVDRYTAGRDMAKLGEGMKKGAREELREVQGVLPDGRMVTWTRGGSAINVVETTISSVRPMGAVLDQAVAAIAPSEPEEPTRETRAKYLSGLTKPELVNIASSDYDLEAKGVKATLVERILDHEFPEDASAFTEMAAPQVEAETAAHVEALTDLAMQGGSENDETAVLRRRQELFGLDSAYLHNEARQFGVDQGLPRQVMIQAIIDAQFPPIAGRGWSPNGGTSGDKRTDRLRQAQYNADPAMRRKYEEQDAPPPEDWPTPMNEGDGR